MTALVRTTESRPIGKMRLDEHGRWILADVEPHVSIRLKQLFARIAKHEVPPYVLPGDAVTAADLAWFASRYAFEMPAEDHERLLAGEALFKRNSAAMEAIFLPDWQPPPGGAGLREGQVGRVYQHQAVEMFWRRGSLLLGDVVGLGKTYTGALALVRPGALPAAVVVDGKHLSDPKALGTYLREQHVYLRRTKQDVGQEMPPVNRIIETVEHSAATLASIDDVVRQLASRVVFGEFTDRGEAARELDWRLRHATGLAKAKGVASYVRLLLESGAPVLLAGWHRDVYDVWQKELKDFNPMLYTGTESPAQKERVAQLIRDEIVSVRFIGRTDPYRRPLVYLRIPAGDVGMILIAEGLALPYRGGSAARQQRIEHWCGDQ